MTGQLVLDLPHRSAAGREDFLVAPCNNEAVALVDSWPAWTDIICYLYGPSASGKTHLLDIWARKAKADVVCASRVGRDLTPHELVKFSALALDNLDRLDPAAQDILFHIINEARSLNMPMLFAARVAPQALKLNLPDLVSRLRALPAIAMGEPDDSLLRGLLSKLLKDRQLSCAPHVVNFIVDRIERDCASVKNLVVRLDEMSLAEKRPLTRALAAEALAHC